jgi:hypothetical protein
MPRQISDGVPVGFVMKLGYLQIPEPYQNSLVLEAT